MCCLMLEMLYRNNYHVYFDHESFGGEEVFARWVYKLLCSNLTLISQQWRGGIFSSKTFYIK